MSTTTIVLKIIQLIKSLKKLSESEYETDQCLDYLKKIDNSFNDEKSCRNEIAKAMIDSNYPEISLKCLKYYTRQNIFENDQTWPCTFYLLRSIWNYTDISSDLAVACACYIPILLDFLSNEYLSPTNEEDEKLFKLTLNILNNIAHQPETKIFFQQNQASKILKKICNIENEHLKVLIHIILSQIINENDFDKVNDPSNEIIEALIMYIKESLKKDKRYKGITTREYIECITKLAVNKENKIKIIEYGMLNIIKAILNNSNSIDDQSHSLNCLWNLVFDDKICELVKKDKDILSLISNFKNLSPSEEIRRITAGILFTLNELKKKEHTNKPTSESSSSLEKRKMHVMISYDNSSKELCLKIKEQLKEKSYIVWMENENLHGNSLGLIAEAVENASVFLMCVSEKYYLSPLCRFEAELAVRLHKPIIPIIMQPGYMPLGWLSIIIGEKLYYKFAGAEKKQLEHIFFNLFKEINRYLDDQIIISSTSSSSNTSINNNNNNNNNKQNKASKSNKSNLNNIINTSNPYSNNIPMINNNSNDMYNKSNINNQIKNSNVSKTVIDWTTREVKQWLSSLNLSTWIVESDIFDNINGMMLKELYEIKINAPDSFYNIIGSKLSLKAKKSDDINTNFQLYDLLKFSSELNEIFKN